MPATLRADSSPRNYCMPSSGSARSLDLRYHHFVTIEDRESLDAADRFRWADALTADSCRIAEAARRSLAGAPDLPPWQRHRVADAHAHRALQRALRDALGKTP